jgi:alkanesulfonate monooxygenase SsuD/methylene tetrahydromethanopterin reductase-like flavin-dependent oxidoreductase (luciferase family)
MNPLQFGVFLQPQYADLGRLRENVHAAEDSGLDFVAIMDHPESPQLLDALTVISVLIGETSRIRLISDVINSALRPPVMLAKAAAGLDLLSGGRFEMGLGGGGNWQATAALTGQHLEPRQVVDAFEEAITIILPCLTRTSQALRKRSIRQLATLVAIPRTFAGSFNSLDG